MPNIIVFRTSPLIELAELEQILRHKFPHGVWLNTYKIEQMLNPISASVITKATKTDLAYLPLLYFFRRNYFPIILIGAFTSKEINYFIELFGADLTTISFYSSDEASLSKIRNRINYSLLNTKDVLTRLKYKRTAKYSFDESVSLNKQILETSILTDISIDVSMEDSTSMVRRILSLIQ